MLHVTNVSTCFCLFSKWKTWSLCADYHISIAAVTMFLLQSMWRAGPLFWVKMFFLNIKVVKPTLGPNSLFEVLELHVSFRPSEDNGGWTVPPILQTHGCQQIIGNQRGWRTFPQQWVGTAVQVVNSVCGWCSYGIREQLWWQTPPCCCRTGRSHFVTSPQERLRRSKPLENFPALPVKKTDRQNL